MPVRVTDSELAVVVDRLVAAGCVAAAEEAADFVAAAPDPATLESWLRRREQGEPQGWITNRIEFCGRPLHLAAGVYPPRRQTEELARRAAALLPHGGRAVDLCTGAGAIAAHLHAHDPSAFVIGVDLDPGAAGCAQSNGVPTVVADLGAALHCDNPFDVVTAVAPYVPSDELRLLPADVQRYEPRLALDGGADGLGLVRRVVEAAARLLKRRGWLLIEVGGDQDTALNATLEANGFETVDPWFDEDGDLRGIAAQHDAGP